MAWQPSRAAGALTRVMKPAMLSFGRRSPPITRDVRRMLDPRAPT
jgi:hypothetical protein